jgi:D-galactarolactone cycloisomerase
MGGNDRPGLQRRELIGGALGAGTLALPAAARTPTPSPVRKLAAEVKRINIKDIETFDIQVPQPPTSGPVAPLFRGGTRGRINVVRLTTDSGVRGYSFLVSSPEDVAAARALLLGQDQFALEAHLKRGLLAWPAVEEAMWDAIGKIAGQPVARLLGGASLDGVPAYLTYVWPTPPDETKVQDQAKQAALVRDAGFKAMKIQMFRTDWNVDAEACAEILAVGGRGFRVMVDRTATARGLWTYEQGLAAAKALKKAGCFWLEEPFARDDYDGPARLRKDVDLLITGGEGWRGLEPFRQSVLHGTYSILQPEVRTVSGIAMTRKVGVLAEAWGLPIAPHAASGLAMAGRLQCSAAMGAMYQEIGPFAPHTFPWDIAEPFLPILHGVQPFRFKDGEVLLPPHAGLGLNIDDDALSRFRVEGFERRGPGTGPFPTVPPRPA